MKRSRLVAIGVLVGALALTTTRLGASDPVGVYCLVQKVVMAPDDSHPTTIQVWGTFALWTPAANTNGTFTPGWYAAPQKGYLYYSLAKGNEAVSLKEWADLKSVAGTGEMVGFAGRYKPVGRFRAATEKPADPDPYPIQMGVVKMANNRYAIDTPGMTYGDLLGALKRVADGK